MSAIVMAMVGLAAALLTGRDFPSFTAGAAYGCALAFYFITVEQRRDALKLGLFVGVCTVTPVVAGLSGYVVKIITTPGGDFNSLTDIPLASFFLAGFIGALLVLGAGMLLFGRVTSTGTTAPKLLGYSAACALLAAATAYFDRAHANQNLDYRLVPLVWQPACAAALAMLLVTPKSETLEETVSPAADGDQSVTSEYNPRLVGWVLLGFMVLCVILWIALQ